MRLSGPLSLTLSPKGRGKSAAPPLTRCLPTHAQLRPSVTHPLPIGERAGERGSCALRQTEIQTMEARALRQALHDAERLLWHGLRARRLAGLKFRRQVPLGPHVAGFYCAAARLVVEVEPNPLPDGRILPLPFHHWLATADLHLLLLRAPDVLCRPGAALRTIHETARNRMP